MGVTPSIEVLLPIEIINADALSKNKDKKKYPKKPTPLIIKVRIQSADKNEDRFPVSILPVLIFQK